MHFTKRWPAVCGLALAWPATALGADTDNPACSPNPVFARVAGERLDNCQRVRFNELLLRRWVDPNKPAAGTQGLTVEGEYWCYHSPIAKDAQGRDAGKLEVRRHFEDAFPTRRRQLAVRGRGRRPGFAALHAQLQADVQAQRAGANSGSLEDAASALNNAVYGDEEIGAAFSRDADEGGSASGVGPQPGGPPMVRPVGGEGQFVTVRVPRGAVTGPLAVVTLRGGIGGSSLRRCQGNGPDLVVAPAPTARP